MDIGRRSPQKSPNVVWFSFLKILCLKFCCRLLDSQYIGEERVVAQPGEGVGCHMSTKPGSWFGFVA